MSYLSQVMGHQLFYVLGTDRKNFAGIEGGVGGVAATVAAVGQLPDAAQVAGGQADEEGGHAGQLAFSLHRARVGHAGGREMGKELPLGISGYGKNAFVGE